MVFEFLINAWNDNAILFVYALLAVLPAAFLFIKGKKPKFLIMLGSKRLAGGVSKIAKYFGHWFDVGAQIGIVLGAGVFGLHYVLKQYKLKGLKLALAFAGLTVAFFALNYVISFSDLFALSDANRMISSFIMTGLGISFFLVVALLDAGVGILANAFQAIPSCPSVAPVLPGVKLPGLEFSIPLLEGWLALVIAMVIHEFSHGVLIRHYGLKLQSVGIMNLGLLPVGAFAEPDEKEFEKANAYDRFKILVAGSMSNLMVAVVAGVIFFALINPAWTAVNEDLANNTVIGSVVVTEVMEENGACGGGGATPAVLAGVQPGWELVSINDRNITSVNALSDSVGPRHSSEEVSVVFRDLQGNLMPAMQMTLNDFGRIGVSLDYDVVSSPEVPQDYALLRFAQQLFLWTWLLNFLIALFNFLPLGPIDGGRMQPELMGPYFKKWFKGDSKKAEKALRTGFGYFLLVLILVNALPWFLNPFF